jgi:uncharacterized secreted protein with C-terminal beta-propeller domain
MVTDKKQWLILAFAFVCILVFTAIVFKTYQHKEPILETPEEIAARIFQKAGLKQADLVQFQSEADLRDYLKKSQGLGQEYFGFKSSLSDIAVEEAPSALSPEGNLAQSEPNRISETNVQVAGIDEPDIIKTNGKEIYYSGQTQYRVMDVPESIVLDRKAIMPPQYEKPSTKIIQAFPPSSLAQIGSLNWTGNLLLTGNTLIIFDQQQIYGFNVSNPAVPIQLWDYQIGTGGQLEASRLYQNKIYLVVSTSLNSERPCPFIPLQSSRASVDVKCVDIYHPSAVIPADVTYTVLVIDPVTGQVGPQLTTIGSSADSVVYMSPTSLYLTYAYTKDKLDYYAAFLSANSDLVPQTVIDKVKRLQTYDISASSKLNEYQMIIQEYRNSLQTNEQLKFDNDLNNRLQAYDQEHSRELYQTGLVKINLADMNLSATTTLPGRLLDQFSMDEYQENLRLATTVGQPWNSRQNTNDIYVLNKNLQKVGEVTDLGLEERIYSVRFIGDKGYLVTFRQTDPFFVLDLSNPRQPTVKGQLKIPGYSSYLHPLTDNLILGIGKEANQVKLSLFNVALVENPIEQDKYLLDEYSSEALDDHHAFLQDDKHQVFFLPGSQGGYVFSYANGLELVKAISGQQAKRALYLNDYLYIVFNDHLIVLNEADWTEVNHLNFN